MRHINKRAGELPQTQWFRRKPDRCGKGLRALIVENQYRLYPAILDEAAIKAARVEATLRRNEAQEDEALATYYIELNVTRTN